MKCPLGLFWVHIVTLITASSIYAPVADAKNLGLGNPALEAESSQIQPTLISVHELPTFSKQGLVAQIIPDDTLDNEGSVLSPEGTSGNILVEGGARRGLNLFHSFEEFNVNSGQEVLFANPTSAENIFSRVTGQSVSNINGLLGVDGTGNLFFLNPNGVIFGPDAKLELDGVLTVSVSEGFSFADGSEFSTDPITDTSLLSMGVPLGVQYNSPLEQESIFSPQLPINSLLIVSPDDIQISEQPNSNSVGSALSEIFEFRVSPEFLETLLEKESVILETPSRIIFQGLTDVVVTNETDGSTRSRYTTNIQNFSTNDFSLLASNIDIINTRIQQEGSGNLVLITPQSSRNRISIQSPDIGDSIQENDRRTSNDMSALFTFDDTQGGMTGDITLTTGVFDIDEGRISSLNAPNGRSGDININASESIRLSGRSQVFTEIQSQIEANQSIPNIDIGTTGEIRIVTNILAASESSIFASATRGQGDAGRILITANEIIFDGSQDRETNPSGIFNRVEPNAVGNGGDIVINTNSLRVLDGARVTTSSLSQGNAGRIQVFADENFEISNDSTVNASSFFQGDSGLIEIKTRNLSLDNNASIFSRVESPASSQNIFTNRGNGRGISIVADSLNILGASRITSDTLGSGDSGPIRITAREGIRLEGFQISEGSLRTISTINTNVGSSGRRENVVGNGGNIEISTGFLEILDSARIIASTFSNGNSGEIIINSGAVTINDLDALGIDNSVDSRAGIYNRVEGYLRSNGEIVTDNQGNPLGNPAEGDSGGITITTDSLTLLNNARVTTTTGGDGESGNLSIVARTVDLSSSELSAESFSSRIAGNINISSAEQIRLRDASTIETDATSAGGGNITLRDIGVLLLRGGSRVSAESGSFEESGAGGNISIFDTDFVVTVPAENNDILANAFRGQGGNISLTADRIIGFTPRFDLEPDEILNLPNNSISDISASSQLGLPGQVAVNNLAIDPAQGLNELPTNLSDASDEITEGCRANRRNIGSNFESIQNENDTAHPERDEVENSPETERITQPSQFTVVGRGGLPPSPSNSMASNIGLVPWVTAPGENLNEVVPIARNLIPSEMPILLAAQGWETRANGQVVFVAEPSISDALGRTNLPTVASCATIRH